MSSTAFDAAPAARLDGRLKLPSEFVRGAARTSKIDPLATKLG